MTYADHMIYIGDGAIKNISLTWGFPTRLRAQQTLEEKQVP